MSKAFTRGCGWGVLLGVVLTLVLPVLFLGCFGTIGTGLGFPVYSASLDVVTDPEVEESLRATADWLEVDSEDPLDAEILEACGEWGGRITHEEAQYILTLWESRLDEPAQERFTADGVIDKWTASGGMTHIFCGEPERYRLGGLHYEARVEQAIRRGWLYVDQRRLRRNGDLIESGFVYEAGDSFRRSRNIKSYVHRLRAEDILTLTTSGAAGLRDGACTTPIPQNGLEWKVIVKDGDINTAWPVVKDDSASPCQQ